MRKCGIIAMRILNLSLFAIVVSFVGVMLHADDATGVYRVSVASNGEEAVGMPFEPFGDGLPDSFLAGPFVGDGGDGADFLHHLSVNSGGLSSYSFTQEGWMADGTNGPAARLGDVLLLSPGAGGPLDVFVYGRVPKTASLTSILLPGENLLSYGFPRLAFATDELPAGLSAPVGWDGTGIWDGFIPWWRAFVVTNTTEYPVVWTRSRPYPRLRSGFPVVSGMAVDVENARVELLVSTGGTPIDILVADSLDGYPSGSGWTHLERRESTPAVLLWRDGRLIDGIADGSARFYMVSDVKRDTDGDGIPDAVERHVYGTSPFLSDTDGDGIDDGFELAWGSDPRVPDQPDAFSFVETFEPPEVRLGDIGGQNGWMTDGPDAAVVQSNVVHSGIGALEIHGGQSGGDALDVFHAITCGAQVVWIDVRQRTSAMDGTDAFPEDRIVAYGFDRQGHPIMTDGDSVFTNVLFFADRTSRWTRCTCRIDFADRRWDFYVDGMIVGDGLALHGDARTFREFGFAGGGFVDDIKLSTERPQGLSSDGDAMPDEWEFRHFGNLDRDGTGDFDGDGISDLAEFRAGTDPLVPNIDTDGDGMPDWWELANGLDPNSPDRESVPILYDPFEPPDTNLGDINGRNGWIASRDGLAYVQSGRVHAGQGALEIGSVYGAEFEDVNSVYHSVTTSADIVWTDVRQFVSRDVDMSSVPEDAFVVYAFDKAGYPIMANGDQFFTNRFCAAVGELEWARCTCRIDFSNQIWDFYVNGMLVGRGLAMCGKNRTLHAVGYEGGYGVIDDLVVSKERPAGLSSDGDGMPDEWELERFGTLDRDGSGDFDGDGLSDLAEFLAGTDPSVRDTDGDGMPDGWEVANGLNPLDPADAEADPDGDGVPNIDEWAHGGDPHLDEPDPRIRRPGLRTEFWRTVRKQATLPDFADLMPSAACVSPRVEHPAVPWLDDGSVIGNYFACRLEGFVRIPAFGRYTFHLTSNAGAVLHVDGSVVLSDPDAHSARTKSVALDLDRGYHTIRVDYYKNTGSETLLLEWSGADIERTVIPDSAFCHLPVEEPLPAGYVRGLEVAYYALPAACGSMPDVSALDPVATCVVERVCRLRTVDAWEGAPPSLVDRFASIHSGALLVPKSGCYTFTLASDDGARLWIDGEKVIDHATAHSWASRKGTVPLSQGVHDIKVEHFENTGDAGLQLSWSNDGTPSEVIPSRFFLRPSGGLIDSDGDGMPDWWEDRHGLNSADPSDAALDPDSDGLTNLEEFHAGTDPHLPDTDGDGIPDRWEILHALCPFYGRDAFVDSDGDGALNIEEFVMGTDVWMTDTDGDGVSDGDEMHVYLSDPTAVDFDGGFVTNAILAASDADAAYGYWYSTDDEVILAGRSGTVMYTNDLYAAHSGCLMIRFKAAFSGPYDAELACNIDGERAGVVLLPASTDVRTNDVAFLTRWLQPGLHEMTFELQNFANGIEFYYWDVAVGEPTGPDGDGNGRPDWLDARMRNSCVDRGESIRSKVSPFCLRGRAIVPPAVEAADMTLAVRPLPYSGWWADVPLCTTNGTAAAVTYEGGMKTETVQIVWERFNVMDESDLVIRRGDSLLLSIGEAAEGAILVDGTPIQILDGGICPYRFEADGDHVVEGLCGGLTNAVAVKVVSSSLPDEMPVWRGKVNTFRVQGAGFDDMAVSVDKGAEIVQASATNGVCTGLLSVPAFGRPTALSFEIPNPDASVAGSMALKPFSAYYTLEGTYYVFKVLGDGTRVVENRLSAFDVPASVSLRMTSSSGICFKDGSGRLNLNADSFGPTGDYIYRFYVPVGVDHPCQFLRAYHDGKEIAQ